MQDCCCTHDTRHEPGDCTKRVNDGSSAIAKVQLINAKVLSRAQDDNGTQYLKAFGSSATCSRPNVIWSPNTLSISNLNDVQLFHAGGQLQDIRTGNGASNLSAFRMMTFNGQRRPVCSRRVGIDYGPFTIINTQSQAVLSVDCVEASQLRVKGGGCDCACTP